MEMVGLGYGVNGGDGDGRVVPLLLLGVVEGVGCWMVNAMVPKAVTVRVEVLDCDVLVSGAAVT
jgi:hypothetical protein